MNYVIEAVRKVTGAPHERELRRKGHRVCITNCVEGECMVYTYPDDGDALVQTSVVMYVEASDEKLVVETCNSVYTFRKEAAI